NRQKQSLCSFPRDVRDAYIEIRFRHAHDETARKQPATAFHLGDPVSHLKNLGNPQTECPVEAMHSVQISRPNLPRIKGSLSRRSEEFRLLMDHCCQAGDKIGTPDFIQRGNSAPSNDW